MNSTVSPQTVSFSKGVSIIGGGLITHGEWEQLLEFSTDLIGADGGGNTIFEKGLTPQYLIGDFDSIEKGFLNDFSKDKQIYIQDQDQTDLDKCLGIINAPFILCVGVLGDRVDHALSAFNCLLKYPNKRIILMNEVDLCFLLPQNITLNLPANERISLFPFGKIRGKSKGLHWEINSIVFSIEGMIGTSNRTVSGQVQLSFFQPSMVCIVSRKHLDRVLEGLQQSTPFS